LLNLPLDISALYDPSSGSSNISIPTKLTGKPKQLPGTPMQLPMTAMDLKTPEINGHNEQIIKVFGPSLQLLIFFYIYVKNLAQRCN